MVFRYNINQFITNSTQASVLQDSETINLSNSASSTDVLQQQNIKARNPINQDTSRRKLKELTPKNKAFLSSLGFKVL